MVPEWKWYQESGRGVSHHASWWVGGVAGAACKVYCTTRSRRETLGTE